MREEANVRQLQKNEQHTRATISVFVFKKEYIARNRHKTKINYRDIKPFFNIKKAS